MHWLTALCNAVLHRLQQDLANFYRSIFSTGGRANPAYRRANARNQFPCAERLGNVIVRSRFQCLHLVFFLVANREHQDWQSRSKCANAPQRLNAADTRHIHIKQNHIHGARAQQLQRLFAARCFGHLEAELNQRWAQCSANRRFVVNNKNPDYGLAGHVLPFCVESGIAAKNVVPSCSSLVTHT